MARYGMLINTKKCIGCYACRVACQRQNDLLPNEDFIRYEEKETGTYPTVRVETVRGRAVRCGLPDRCCLPRSGWHRAG